MPLFHQKPLEETLREQKNAINQSIRDIERERRQYETREKDLTAKLKQAANKGHMGTVKQMAKDLVRLRSSIQKCFQMRSQMQALNLRLQTLKSTTAISDSMKDVSTVLSKVNKVLELPKIQQQMKSFMKESAKFEFSQEAMQDTMDSVFDSENAEAEEDKIVSETLESLGIDMSAVLAGAGTKTDLPNLAVQPEKDSVDDYMDDRLKKLNR